MSEYQHHILIAGGGLGGPCLALCLAKQGFRSTIFELRPYSDRSAGGGSISLGANAIQVLDRYAGVYERVRSVGYAYHRFGAYTEEGEKLGEIQVGNAASHNGSTEGNAEGNGHGYPAIRILRSELHRILMEACEAEKEMIEVQYSKKLTQVEETKDGVTIHFEDGTIAAADQAGDALIGADGIRSRVREYVLGPSNNPTPKYEGICVVNGYVPRTAAVVPSPDFQFPAMMFTRSGMFMTIPVDGKGETLAWGINMTVDDLTREAWAEFERSGEAARLAKAEYDGIETQPIRSSLEAVDDKSARLWATYSIPDIGIWHTSRTCLIGDAAHGLPPNGLGSAMAFEDGALLALIWGANKIKSLSDDNDVEVTYEKVFDRFQQIRHPRLAKLRRDGRVGSAFRSKSGDWLWYLKKWMFRGFFWYKGGVLGHMDEPYDWNSVDLSV